jgi:hypothetical protein
MARRTANWFTAMCPACNSVRVASTADPSLRRNGHATVAFTLDVHSHAVPAMEAEAADRVAALIFNPTQ